MLDVRNFCDYNSDTEIFAVFYYYYYFYFDSYIPLVSVSVAEAVQFGVFTGKTVNIFC